MRLGVSYLGPGNEARCELPWTWESGQVLVTLDLGMRLGMSYKYCHHDVQFQRSGGTIWMFTYLQLGE